MSDLPALRPPFSAEAAPYWGAVAEGRLVLPVCDACDHTIWYPRAWCPVCGSPSVTWTPMSGGGTVYARTVIRKGMGPWATAAPYVVAYVELEEGPRILANVITDDPEAVVIGSPVRATFVPVADVVGNDPDDGHQAQAILRFTPAP